MNWILFAIHAPGTIFGALVVALGFMTGLLHRPRYETMFGTPIVLTAQWRPWFARRYRYSTALGRAVVFHPDARDSVATRWHETVHIYQYEDYAALGLLAFPLTLDLCAGGIVWCSSVMWPLMNLLTAGLRFGWKNAYRKSTHERDAYNAEIE